MTPSESTPEEAANSAAPSSSVRILFAPPVESHEADVTDDGDRRLELQRKLSRRSVSSMSTTQSQTRSTRGFSFQRRRPRGLSGSSIRSGASSNSKFSRPRSVFVDSDHESDGANDTEEDVCFPFNDDTSHDGVNITELDQLLNDLTDEEDKPAVEGPDNNGQHSSLETKVEESPNTESPDTLQEDVLKSPAQLRVPFMFSRRHECMPDLELPEPQIENPDSSTRFSFFATQMDSTTHSSDLASLVGPDESFASLFNSNNGIWWLDCENPTESEMRILSRAFGIHPLTSEDIRTEESREKFELFKNYYFVVFNTFETCKDDPEYLEPINFYIIVYNDGVLSFHFSPVDHCRNVRRRMRQLREYVDVTPDWICYALIDNITDTFAPIIHDIEQEVDFIENAVFVREEGDSRDMSTIFDRLGKTRGVTMRMLRLLTGKAEVIRGFAKRCKEVWATMPGSENNGSDIALFLGDIEDHLVSMYQNLTAYEKILSRCHFNYMGVLQLEFVNSNNRMTTVLSKVTLIGTVLVPMNLVTGMFGMNVKVPGEGVENLDWFFGIFAVVVFTICALLYLANTYITRLGR